MAFQEIPFCISQKPGHNPNQLYVGKSRNYQRYPALVHLIGTELLRIELAVQEFEVFHHLATEVYLKSLCVSGGELLYAPEAQLLYLPARDGSWLVAHLATSESHSPCIPGITGTQELPKHRLEAEER